MKDKRLRAKRGQIFFIYLRHGGILSRLGNQANARSATVSFIFFILLMATGTTHAGGIMDLTKAVIHHTAGSKITDRDLSVAEIDIMHKRRGWDGIGYHFVIQKDGTINKGRHIYKQGAHAKGRNLYIGIALTGYEEFSQSQIESLKRLLRGLNIKHIERHHEECPGPGLDVEKIQIEIEEAK